MNAVLAAPAARRSGALGRTSGPVVALAAAVLAVVCLLSGLSYPGFPMDVATCGCLAAAASVVVGLVVAARALDEGRGSLRAVGVLAVVTAVLAAGVLAAGADDGRRLQGRFAASRAAFEQEVSTAGVPVRSTTPDTFAPYPGACPARIGELAVGECRSVDGGFLFLQAQGALTDDSGIVYLPEAARPTSSWWRTERMTPLGGPWWSWTCGC